MAPNRRVAAIILIPILTLAVLLLLLIKFGRRKPATTAKAPPVTEPDAGLHRNYGLPTLPGATDGDFFGTAEPDDADFRSGGGSFGGGGATGDWSDDSGGESSGGSDGGGSD